jgi:PPP family 3-phenylpropionic acid transporter
LDRWKPQGLLAAAIFLTGIRVFSYSLMIEPWPALLIQLLHGPTYSAIWVAGVSYADKIAPAGLGATAQGIFSGVLLGLGYGTGAVLGGRIYENMGAVAMFQIFSLIVFAALAIFQISGRKRLSVETT